MSIRRGILALVMVTILWGTTFSAIKFIMNRIPPSAYATYRSLIASLALFPFIFNRGKEVIRTIKAGFILGVLYFFGLLLQAWGMVYTTASNAAFITSFNVPLVCLLEVIILRRKPSLALLASMAMAISGVLLLSVEFRSFSFSYGDLIVLACTIFWALQIIYIDKYSRMHNVLVLTFMQLVISGLVGLVVCGVMSEIVRLDEISLSILLYLAIFCSSITCLLQVYGQRFTTSTQAAIIYTLEPVFASFFATILLHEILSLKQYIGSLLILAATYLAIKSEVEL